MMIDTGFNLGSRDFETLKIDQRFVFDIDTGGLGAAFVPLIIRIADELEQHVSTVKTTH